MWSHAPKSILPVLLHGINYPLNTETTPYILLRDLETLLGNKTACFETTLACATPCEQYLQSKRRGINYTKNIITEVS